MKICSFDVGKGNLAYTIMNIHIQNKTIDLNKSSILDFDLIDLINPNHHCMTETCQGIIQSGKRKGLQCTSNSIGNDKFCGRHGGTKLVKKKTISLQELCRNMKKILDTKKLIDTVDIILIETQPVKFKKMCEVSHYLFSYCIFRTSLPVRYITARGRMYYVCSLFKNKVKLHSCATYKDRKSNSILLCDYLLDTYFKSHLKLKSLRKKDDVADCIIQTIWYLCKYKKYKLFCDTENTAK